VAGGRLESAPKPAVVDKVADRFVPAPLDRQQMAGLLGQRMQANLASRLLKLDIEPLLAGFEHRPGVQDWIGEHAGKFLHAASNAWMYGGSEPLLTRMQEIVRRMAASQKDDGYLGTYLDQNRWTSWDVWVHKYDLIGLLAYYGATGDRTALQASRKIGDLLCRTFGQGQGQRDIVAAGTHVGMAATSVLEPMCMLYRMTGDPKYLDFCRYIIAAYDGPHGPRLVRSLTEHGDVQRTANAKAYEMLSNLVGVTDLYRLTGDPALPVPPLNAWKDIAAHRLYVTGSASYQEHFLKDGILPGTGDVGEMCVTVTWMQLNWHLLRLSGEAKYGDALEHTVYNALLGGQNPATGNICYFTPLIGTKPYGTHFHGVQGVNCCISSGQRGVALIPSLAWGTLGGGPAVVLYTPGQAVIPVTVGGKQIPVTLISKTDYPVDGQVLLTLRMDQPAAFPVSLRVPGWCAKYTATVEGEDYPGKPGEFLVIQRTWKPGDEIHIDMDMTVRVLSGGASYPQNFAIQRGPQILARDDQVSKQADLVLAEDASGRPATLRLQPAADRLPAGWLGVQAYTVEGQSPDAVLVPFADAGQTGGNYRVWLGPLPVESKAKKK
jgi:DUF1680 family protein